jgi:hypothetical protein
LPAGAWLKLTFCGAYPFCIDSFPCPWGSPVSAKG